MRVEKETRVYKGTYKNGVKYNDYLFTNGTQVTVADLFVNARNVLSAVNKLARKLGLHTYNDAEELAWDIECGYFTIEEVNYYDEESNETYKYYVSAIYA